MRAVSKADYGKGGNIPSYEVLKVVTDGGEFNSDEMYFYDYDEDAEYPCWEKRRYEIAKSAMQGILADKDSNVLYNSDIARKSVEYADALIAELKNKGE